MDYLTTSISGTLADDVLLELIRRGPSENARRVRPLEEAMTRPLIRSSCCVAARSERAVSLSAKAVSRSCTCQSSVKSSAIYSKEFLQVQDQVARLPCMSTLVSV